MSSDNWQGDRDLDSHKDEDWKGRVFDGKYDERYKGVGKYGSGRPGGRSPGGYHFSSRKRRKDNSSKIIVAIVVPILVIGAFIFVTQTDFNQDDADNQKIESSLFSSLDKPETVILNDCIMRSDSQNNVEISCKDLGKAQFYSETPVKTTIKEGVTIEQNNNKYTMWFLSPTGQKQTFSLQKVTPSLDIGKSISDSLQYSLPKLEIPELKIPSTLEVPQVDLPQIQLEDLFVAKPTSIEESKKAIDYINSLRIESDRNPIGFDQRAYELSLARVRDTIEYDYFDHTNPITGTCPDSMKSSFGFSSNEYVAENLAGGISNPISAVDLWMTSQGHRYNLLYSTHVAGAVACESGNCAFLGLNYDGFGTGCHTGAEGEAFHKSLGRCSDEEFLQYDKLREMYDQLGKEYERFPKVVNSQEEYQRALMMYNQLQDMYNQIVNFRCD